MALENVDTTSVNQMPHSRKAMQNFHDSLALREETIFQLSRTATSDFQRRMESVSYAMTPHPEGGIGLPNANDFWPPVIRRNPQ
jgi:hypothetical protein